tara:strand:+ start:595 stop:837 length:243 start_codon:yes stop_codon:yes gene_type:complete
VGDARKMVFRFELAGFIGGLVVRGMPRFLLAMQSILSFSNGKSLYAARAFSRFLLSVGFVLWSIRQVAYAAVALASPMGD